jgi:hypothetical protein
MRNATPRSNPSVPSPQHWPKVCVYVKGTLKVVERFAQSYTDSERLRLDENLGLGTSKPSSWPPDSMASGILS